MPRSPLNRPLVITQDFGVPETIFGINLGKHKGIDLRSPNNDPWFMCVPGVLHLGGTWPYATGYGAYWKLDWGQAEGHITFIYGHAKNRDKSLDGRNMGEGTKIAVSGNTGLSTAYHLHFEMRRYLPNKPYTLIDPKEWLRENNIPYTYK